MDTRPHRCHVCMDNKGFFCRHCPACGKEKRSDARHPKALPVPPRLVVPKPLRRRLALKEDPVG